MAARWSDAKPLDIVETEADGRMRLDLAGQLDYRTAPQLAGRIQDLRSDGHRELELDLTELTDLDATGLAVLLTARQRFAGAGDLVVLRGASSHLRRVLEVTGVARLFELA